MWRLIRCSLLAAALGGFGAAAVAAPHAGDREITAQASIQDQAITGSGLDSTTSTTTTAMLEGGYFLNPHLQLGVSYLISQSLTKAAGVSVTSGAEFIDGLVNYHFETSNVALWPYVGARFGVVRFAFNGTISQSFSPGIAAGVRYFPSEDLSINAEYGLRSYSVTIEGTTINISTATMLVGFSYFFGASKS
jgi:hypothetical protein